jgi:hypothetical protein
MRGKRAVAMAPKRELLIETDESIATRKILIAASHIFDVKMLDFKGNRSNLNKPRSLTTANSSLFSFKHKSLGYRS